MIRAIILASALWYTISFVLQWLIASSLKQKFNVLKSIVYSTLCAILTTALLVLLIKLF